MSVVLSDMNIKHTLKRDKKSLTWHLNMSMVLSEIDIKHTLIRHKKSLTWHLNTSVVLSDINIKHTFEKETKESLTWHLNMSMVLSDPPPMPCLSSLHLDRPTWNTWICCKIYITELELNDWVEIFDCSLIDESVIVPHELMVLQPWHPIFKLTPGQKLKSHLTTDDDIASMHGGPCNNNNNIILCLCIKFHRNRRE